MYMMFTTRQTPYFIEKLDYEPIILDKNKHIDHLFAYLLLILMDMIKIVFYP